MTLIQELATLETSGLVRLVRTQPELEYLFRHALLQDAAYTSLLKATRKELHQQVGEVLERLYPSRLEELAPVLAQHFYLSDQWPQAINYFLLAGDAAMRLYANEEAYQHYRQAITLLQTTGAVADNLKEAYLKGGRVCELMGRYTEALTMYEELESYAAEMMDERLKLAALIARATVYCAPTQKYDALQGEVLCQAALVLAQKLNDRVAEAKILWNLALAYKFKNQWTEVLRYGEQAIAIARELNLREQLAYLLNDLYPAYMSVGRMVYAMQLLEEASLLWRELNNFSLLVDNLTGLSNTQLMFGQEAEGMAGLNEAYEIAVRIQNKWGRSYSAWGLGTVHAFNGNVSSALFYLDEAINFGEEAGFLVAPIAARGVKGLVFSEMGQPERGLAVLGTAIAFGEQLPRWRLPVFAAQARLFLQQGNLALAATAIQQAQEFLTSTDPQSRLLFVMAQCDLTFAQGAYADIPLLVEPILQFLQQAAMKRFVPNLLYQQARAYAALGRRAEAKVILEKAFALAQETQKHPILYLIAGLLAKLAETEPEKQTWLTHARASISFIAAHAPADLRESFLHTPEVKALL